MKRGNWLVGTARFELATPCIFIKCEPPEATRDVTSGEYGDGPNLPSAWMGVWTGPDLSNKHVGIVNLTA
jgi:hypothetical protein